MFRSNSLIAQLHAVKQGIGLSLLHHFIAREQKDLKLLLDDHIKFSREYWIVVHQDLITLKRVRVVLDFFSNVIKKEKNNFIIN